MDLSKELSPAITLRVPKKLVTKYDPRWWILNKKAQFVEENG